MVRLADILKKTKPPQEGRTGEGQPGSSGSRYPNSPQEETPEPSESSLRQPREGLAGSGGGSFRFSTLGLGAAKQAPSASHRPTTAAATPVAAPKPAEGPNRSVAQAVRDSELSRQEAAEKVYNDTLSLATLILGKTETGEEIRGADIHGVIDDIIRELTYGNSVLLDLACSNRNAEGDATSFLSSKIVNKTILAIEIGVGKQMNKSKLFQLGIAAFLSDIGIVEVADIVHKGNQILTDGEKERLKQVPYRTVEILRKVPDLNEVVLTVALESHERMDGSGPLGIRDVQKLDEFSRIVAVIDVFEALTHDRPHRKRLLPHEALKRILEEGGKFEEGVLRLLIDRIGVYPIGSWVRLTNKEVAKVVGANPGQPLRPRLKVMFDERGLPLEQPVLLDLAKNLSIQIAQPLSDEEVKKSVRIDGSWTDSSRS